MSFPQSLALLTLLLFSACAQREVPRNPFAPPRADKPRARRPLFSFDDGEDESRADTAPPTRLLTGDRAKEVLQDISPSAIRIGSGADERSPEEALPVEADALAKAVESARASDRQAIFERLEKLGPAAVEAVQKRRSELGFAFEIQGRALEQLQQTMAAARADIAVSPLDGSDLNVGTGGARFLERRYQLAQDRFLQGDYLGAEQLAEAILTLAPDAPFAPRVKRLRKQSRERLARETVLFTELIAPDSIRRNEALVLKLRLTNRSRKPIVLIPSAEAKGRIGTFTVSYETFYTTGTRARAEESLAIRERKVLKLLPDEQVVIEVEVPAVHQAGRDGLLGRYHIEGRLRPFALERGEEAIPYLIPIFGATTWVIGGAQIAATRDPLATFKDRLDDLDDVLGFLDEERRKARFKPTELPPLDKLVEQAFVAGVLAASWQRPQTIAYIQSILPSAPPQVAEMLGDTLSSISRDPFRYTTEEWLRWYAQGRYKAWLRPGESLSEEDG